MQVSSHILFALFSAIFVEKIVATVESVPHFYVFRGINGHTFEVK